MDEHDDAVFRLVTRHLYFDDPGDGFEILPEREHAMALRRAHLSLWEVPGGVALMPRMLDARMPEEPVNFRIRPKHPEAFALIRCQTNDDLVIMGFRMESGEDAVATIEEASLSASEGEQVILVQVIGSPMNASLTLEFEPIEAHVTFVLAGLDGLAEGTEVWVSDRDNEFGFPQVGVEQISEGVEAHVVRSDGTLSLRQSGWGGRFTLHIGETEIVLPEPSPDNVRKFEGAAPEAAVYFFL